LRAPATILAYADIYPLKLYNFGHFSASTFLLRLHKKDSCTISCWIL